MENLSFINQLHTLILQKDSLVEITTVLFQPDKGKSYQQEVPGEEKVGQKNNPIEKQLCVKDSAENNLDVKWNKTEPQATKSMSVLLKEHILVG